MENLSNDLRPRKCSNVNPDAKDDPPPPSLTKRTAEMWYNIEELDNAILSLSDIDVYLLKKHN